jgi:hypothetical protein
MNQNQMLDELAPEERELAARLSGVAESLQPNSAFVKKTETTLRDAFAAKKEKAMKRSALLWQSLAGAVAVIALALLINWLVRGMAPQVVPTPMPAKNPTVALTIVPTLSPAPTATPQLPSYDWRGTTVYRATAFPAAPTEVGMYTYSPTNPATIDSARSLAGRFGIQGEVYQAPGNVVGTTSLLVTDGKQRLYVDTDGYFSYYAEYGRVYTGKPISKETAAGPVDAFLKAHGFDFDYQLEVANGMGDGWFYIVPLPLEGRPIRSDFGQVYGMSVQVSPDGQVVGLNVNLLNLDAQPVGQFGIISAEEAWQKVIDPNNTLGVLESVRSAPSGGPQMWVRVYPDNETVTIYGNVSTNPSVEAGKPPFITLDIYTLTGSTTGLEDVGRDVVVEASGQFVDEGGIRKFRVDAWQSSSQFSPDYLEGNLRKEGEQVIFSSQGTDYVLNDVPADVPLPLENVNLSGFRVEQNFEWQNISYYGENSMGGGGGGGGDFAKLNLSGIPVPWPTPIPAELRVTPEPLPTGQRVEGLRGMLTVNIYEKADGSRRSDYVFSTTDATYLLAGDNLQELDAYHNRPVTIWGTVTGYNQNQSPIVALERYEIPFPDLKFQILTGTQKLITLDGQQVTLFTGEDGKSYVQLMPAGVPDNNLIGVEGDKVQVEALIIPDETFGGTPAMRTFSGAMAVNPKNGESIPLEITADKPYVLPESLDTAGGSPPTLMIETIELVYYTSDPHYSAAYPEAVTPYIQPVWRFYGHYSNGSEMEIFVQALKQEYLLPEAAPAVRGG